MDAVVRSAVEHGSDGVIVDIECHMSSGLPNIVIVGFGNKAVDEARERVRSAFASLKLELPRKRIIINLAPADLPKDSTSFDLGIAAAILMASEQGKPSRLKDAAMIGELGLDGSVRPVRGIIGKLLAGRKHGIKQFYIPYANLGQAHLVPNIELIPVGSLKDLALDLHATVPIKRIKSDSHQVLKTQDVTYDTDFSDIVGQARAKRVLEIAASGGHNVLMSGPPGTGKSMLAKALPSILPPLEPEEVLHITHLHSLANRNYDKIVSTRPFRAPHHSASDISIVGGGQKPRPGEISLSHGGVLFFDEFPEFSRVTIEALRQPLEDRHITVARARDSITFPADFMLVATANPCPCGYYGTAKDCVCMPAQIVKYQRKLSGPIIDRIDLYVDVDEVEHKHLLDDVKGQEGSEAISKRVNKARNHQMKRYKNPLKRNANLTNRDIKKHASLEPEAQELLNQAGEKLGISARSYMRTIRVARTIADLENSDTITSAHISEALQYRKPVQSII